MKTNFHIHRIDNLDTRAEIVAKYEDQFFYLILAHMRRKIFKGKQQKSHMFLQKLAYKRFI